MTSSLTGKTAVVTGGAKGIGAAVVRRFTADGANVVIASGSEKKVKRRFRYFGKKDTEKTG